MSEARCIARTREIRKSGCSGIRARKRLGLLKIRGIAEEVPLLAIGRWGIYLIGSAEVGRKVVDTPGQGTLKRHNGIERPSLEQLSRRVKAGDIVGRRKGESMSDVKLGRPVNLSRICAVDGA